jgi:signal transduction histidine kinase
MGALWELLSFALRSAGTLNQQSIPLAFASQILVLLAPMWVNAFIYMVMGRMIYFFIPAKSIFHIKGIKIAKIFVWLDVLSFLTQVGGGVMISPGNSPSTLMMGIHIYMGGIGFQEFCILIFTAIAVKFFLEMRALSAKNQILDVKPDTWRNLLFVLFAVLALITVRIIYRLVEFAAGLDPEKNKLPYHEAYFMVLDALPMVIGIVLLNIVHPGQVLQGEGSEFPKGPSRKEKKEAKRVKKEEKKAEKERRKMEKEEKKRIGDGFERV